MLDGIKFILSISELAGRQTENSVLRVFFLVKVWTEKYTNTLFFFYKNLFYKNVEAEIDPNFKNVLRTFLRLRVD